MAVPDVRQARDLEALSPASDEMTFADVAGALRSRWWVPLASMLTCLALALVYDFSATPTYRADTILAASSQSKVSGMLSSMASELGGLAALGGISLSNQQSDTEVAVATLQSRALIEKYVREKHLLPVLFANRWDSAKGTWKNPAKAKQPTLWDAAQLIRHKVETVDLDRLTGLVTLSIKWRNAALAAQWANDLVALANARLRNAAIARTERNIAYLEQLQEQTTLVGVKSAISSLLEEEIKTEMIAKGRKDYAFRIIDPAQAPGRPEWPRRVMLALGGAFVGLLIGTLLVLSFRHRPRRA